MFLIGTVLVIQIAAGQAPPRDARPVPATGSGVIRGSVVDAPSGAPIAGARVTIRAQPGTLVGFISEQGFSAETDTATDGRFEFTSLPAGAFIVIARPGEFRATHLPKVFGHDAPGPLLGGASVTLEPNEVSPDLRIALERSLAIEGVVTNEFGEPMTNVRVTARSEPEIPGAAEARTDDRGRFRLFGLPPADYTICSSPYGGWTMQRPAADVAGPVARYDKTCVPQLVTLTEAHTPIVQLQLQPVRAFSLSGTVVSSTGRDVSNAHISIVRLEPEGSGGTVPAETRNGQFAAHALVPGEYIIRASLNDLSGGTRHVLESAWTSVRLDGADVTGLTIATLPAATITGRIALHPRATAPLPPRLTVHLAPPMDQMRHVISAPPSGAVAGDGSFTVHGIFGPQVIAMPELRSGWFVASVRHGDEDITGRVREFRPGDDRPVTVVLSNRGAKLRARAVGVDGKPRIDALVMVIPTDPTRWNVMPASDITAQDKEGFLNFESIAPGDYYVAAVPLSSLVRMTLAGGTLEPIARAGQKITFVEDQSLTLDVPVMSLGGRQ